MLLLGRWPMHKSGSVFGENLLTHDIVNTLLSSSLLPQHWTNLSIQNRRLSDDWSWWYLALPWQKPCTWSSYHYALIRQWYTSTRFCRLAIELLKNAACATSDMRLFFYNVSYREIDKVCWVWAATYMLIAWLPSHSENCCILWNLDLYMYKDFAVVCLFMYM